MRNTFSQYFIPSASKGEVFVHTAMLAQLVVWAETEPSVLDYELDGPSWKYKREGREFTASIPLTVEDGDGKAYWDVRDERYQGQTSYDAKRAACELMGRRYRVFDNAHFRQNAVEYKNRLQFQRLLARGAAFDSRELETSILLAVDDGALSLDELAKVVKAPLAHVELAAIRLWRRRLVTLPVTSTMFNPAWLVGAQR